MDALLADLRQAREHEPVRITLVPEDAETEALLAAEIAELTADGLLEAVSASALCRYARHRHVGTDWTTREGRTVCGVCHPPVPGAAT